MSTAYPRQFAMFLALFSAMGIGAIGFGIAIPLLPSYATAFHIEAWQVGLIFSLFSVGQAAGEAIWGHMSDRLGRKPVLLATLILSVAGYVGMAFAPTFGWCLVARLVCGLAAGSGGVVQALVLDVSQPERRTINLARIGACSSIGFIIGPAIGGLFARPELGLAGFRAMFLFAAALSLLNSLVIALGVPRMAPPAEATRAVGAPLFRLPGTAIRLMLVGGCVMGAFASVESVFGLWAHVRFGWSARELGLVFALAGGTGAVVQFLVTARAVRRFGDRRVLLFGLWATGVSLMVQAVAPIGGVMAAMIALASLGLSLAMPTSASLLSHEAPPGTAGRVMGTNMAVASAMRILGPLFGGVLFAAISPRAPFLVAGLIVLCTIPLARARRARDGA